MNSATQEEAEYGGSDYEPFERPRHALELARLCTVVSTRNGEKSSPVPLNSGFVDRDRPRSSGSSSDGSLPPSQSGSRTQSRSGSAPKRGAGARSRSRSRSWSRSPSRSRSCGSGHDGYPYGQHYDSRRPWSRSRSRSKSWSHSWSRSRSRSRSPSWSRERWNEPPSSTLILRGLPSDMDELTLQKAVEMWDVPVESVRLIRDRLTGVSRGFAYVDLDNVEVAHKWMVKNRGEVRIGRSVVEMLYRINKHQEDIAPSAWHDDDPDWRCSKCSLRNFGQRFLCKRCGKQRESEYDRLLSAVSSRYTTSQFDNFSADDPTPYIGSSPCDTLLLRNLDALTTEERVCESLAIFEREVLQCRVMRDDLTHASLCYALVQYANADEAKDVLERCARFQHDESVADLTAADIEIGGKLVTLNFSKFSFATLLENIEQEKQQALMTYYGEQTDDINFRTRQDTAEHNEQERPKCYVAAPMPDPYHQTPDTSKFQFEATSGFYYDVNTKYYYDAKSGYFYDAGTTTYMYWDPAIKSYVAVPTSNASNSNESQQAEEKKNKDKKKKEKRSELDTTDDSKTAASKISKEMERWASQVNTQKDVGTRNWQILPASSQTGASGTSSSAKVDSTIDETEKSLLDWQKHVCSLCKRQFNDSETMVKHVRFSDLHKRNVSSLKRSLALERGVPTNDRSNSFCVQPVAMVTTSNAVRYRDRAKERREKVGSDIMRHDYSAYAQSVNESSSSSQTTTQPSFTDKGGRVSDTAVKMMEKMGWQAGQGLGRGGQGRVAPIQVVQREKGAGLGTGYVMPVDDFRPTVSYSEKVRRMAAVRFGQEHCNQK